VPGSPPRLTDEVLQHLAKCSKWLPGRDHAAAARAPVPDPAELKRDIDVFLNCHSPGCESSFRWCR
jgi:hypothetical protein